MLLVCLAPVLASYIAYYGLFGWRPLGGQTNYGTLIEPQRPLQGSGLQWEKLGGGELDWRHWQGKWIMVAIDSGECLEACAEKLYAMRQIRLTTNQEQERIERLWLVNDAKPISTEILRAYDGMHVARAQASQLATFFPVDAGGQVSDGIYLIDPLGNLMMRFPKQANLNRMKKDVNKLLKVTSGWHNLKSERP
ncbi:cytochrome C oxidase subunit I [Parvibium lacunae]|uniref:Cytochrome C oxidase subunit I n=1 Tax=Parvibium lacunae TaxID=1888893 RepID=A0A368L003_9BURK|nr:cytochrome C oxidase subunit I [Parvibium lacunae]